MKFWYVCRWYSPTVIHVRPYSWESLVFNVFSHAALGRRWATHNTHTHSCFDLFLCDALFTSKTSWKINTSSSYAGLTLLMIQRAEDGLCTFLFSSEWIIPFFATITLTSSGCCTQWQISWRGMRVECAPGFSIASYSDMPCGSHAL